jgi:putative ABC transport system ATP-binding protein
LKKGKFMLQLEGIEKTYLSGDVATPVLKGISFEIHPGQYVAIMGASGTGKSTLMNILGCLDKPTEGHYRLDDVDMVNLDDDELSHVRNHKIGFVFQQFHLLQRTSALKNVLLPLIYSDDYPEEAEDLAENALAMVGLADRVEYRPNQLSGGQQQRVAIARALITNPSIILADEPTGNLDSRSGTEVMAIFQRLHRDGRTVIMITHDRDVAEHANRMIVLDDGRIAADEVVDEPRDAEAELAAMAQTEEAA